MYFKSVYRFSVEDAIKNGRIVYCLDRDERSVHKMNSLSYDDALAVLDEASRDHTNRFDFWFEEEEEKNA